jgi:hypothetical protein
MLFAWCGDSSLSGLKLRNFLKNKEEHRKYAGREALFVTKRRLRLSWRESHMWSSVVE